jgi:hypothetical protein
VTTRLLLYNAALLECKERKLASLTEECEARRVLDDVWDGGFVNDVLSEGQWRFASRSVELTPEDDVETLFGYSNAFAIPSDHVRTTALCEDERFQVPLLGYQVEAGYWYADIDPIYLTYVSNDADYGGDLSRWPPQFRRFAELYLAYRILPRLTGSNADRDTIKKDLKRERTEAKSVDSSESPTRFSPQGSWVSARLGSRSTLERGSRSRLIG